MPVNIYLADLTHTGLGVATEAFPLNIGLIASYALKRFGKEVAITLFKYPQELREAIAQHPPHILGCSNYTWNSNLAYHFIQQVKSMDPAIVTVFGGTNYPFDAKTQRVFLAQRPQLDLHTFYEGEEAFANIVERYLSVSGYAELFAEPIPGSHFLHKDTGTLVTAPQPPRIKTLDEIPSPYATGLLDKFFDGTLTPLLETARGCPFTCNFCNAGNTYFNKVNLFSDAYVREEWEYVARSASRTGTGHLTLTDNNFGMIPRDYKTAELMQELKEKYGWPRSVTAWTGKNSKKRVIDVTKLLGDTLVINMAVQSMDREVLKEIARSNISVEDYRAIADELNAQGRPQVAEVIVPLPGETFASHVRGINELLDSNLSTVVVHTLQMLYGTPYKDDPAYVEQHGFIRKYRVVPLDFGTYDGSYVFDTEEVSIGTNTFSVEEYVESRKLLFVIDLCYNGATFEVLKRYIVSQGLKVSEWIQALYRDIPSFPPPVKAVFDGFAQETLGELWDSEEALVTFYAEPANYQKLVRGEAGGNVLFKHKAWMLSEALQEWVDVVFTISERYLVQHAGAEEEAKIATELAELKRFILSSIAGAFALQPDPRRVRGVFAHDILAWLSNDPAGMLADYHQSSPMEVEFSFSPEQLLIKEDAVRRYGAGRAGVVKLIQRLGDIQRFLRRASCTVTLPQ